ncbi:hypothetical protein FKP32DRAFT_611228 [Trametes sanguinea]|nr:hypothetical protein FKP32DRAFT_611228 [Trametes sanguinea]
MRSLNYREWQRRGMAAMPLPVGWQRCPSQGLRSRTTRDAATPHAHQVHIRAHPCSDDAARSAAQAYSPPTLGTAVRGATERFPSVGGVGNIDAGVSFDEQHLSAEQETWDCRNRTGTVTGIAAWAGPKGCRGNPGSRPSSKYPRPPPSQSGPHTFCPFVSFLLLLYKPRIRSLLLLRKTPSPRTQSTLCRRLLRAAYFCGTQ